MQIDHNAVAKFHYTLTNDEGETIDSSAEGEPLAYLHGAGGIIPGLERELVGKGAGDSLKVTVQPADGYGDLNPSMVQEVPREAFQGVDSIEVGQQFQTADDNGQPMMIVVKEVTDSTVVVDGNHPLAGQTLHFDVTIDSVREATETEIEHGHVH